MCDFFKSHISHPIIVAKCQLWSEWRRVILFFIIFFVLIIPDIVKVIVRPIVCIGIYQIGLRIHWNVNALDPELYVK